MAPYAVPPRACVSAALIAMLSVVLYTAGVFLQSVLLSDTARSLVYTALVRVYFLVYALRLSFSQSGFARSLQVFAPYCSRLLDISARRLSFLADDIALVPLNVASSLGFRVSFSLDIHLVLTNCYYILRHRKLSNLPRYIVYLSIHTTRAVVYSSAFQYTALVLLLLFALFTIRILLALCTRDIIDGPDDDQFRVVSSIRSKLALLKNLLWSLQARCFAFLRTHRLLLVVLLGATLSADQLSWHYWHDHSRCGLLAQTYLPLTLKWLYCFPDEPTYVYLWGRLLRCATIGGCIRLFVRLCDYCVAVGCVFALAYTWDIWALFLAVQVSPAEPFLPLDYKLSPEFDAQFELCGNLGRGGNGFVMEARRRSDGRRFAVKFLTKVGANKWQVHPKIGRAPKEVVLATDLCHEHIVKSVAAFEDTTYFYFVQELFGDVWEPRGRPAGRSLDEYLRQHGPIPPDVVHGIFKQLTSAVAYLHSRGIAHCDIKPANILIDRDANIRLIDLGNALVGLDDPLDPHRGRTVPSTSYAGTPLWVPPEMQRGQGDRDVCMCHPFLGDVWAMGLLLYCMVTGVRYPYLGIEMPQGGVELLTEFEAHRGTEAVELVLPVLRLCVEVDPLKRVTMDELACLFDVRPS